MDTNDTSCFFSAIGAALPQLGSVSFLEISTSGPCDLFVMKRGDGRRWVKYARECLTLRLNILLFG